MRSAPLARRALLRELPRAFGSHFSQIDDGCNAIKEGTTVHFVKEFDESKGKERAPVQRAGSRVLRPDGTGERSSHLPSHLTPPRGSAAEL